MAPMSLLAPTLLGHNGTAELQNGGKTPSDVLRTATLVVTIVAITLLAPLLIARALIRGVVVGRWCREDWTCCLAWVSLESGLWSGRELTNEKIFATGYCVTGLLMAIHGGGSHEWEVSPSDLRAFKKILYADTLLYGPSTFLTKTTLLLIFTRVFAHSRKTVAGVYVFIGAMICYYFPVMMVKIRICTPIEGIWDPKVESICFNQQVVFFTDAVVSVITDVVVLVLPLPLVYQLNVSKIKKLRIATLLGAGGLATIASLMRAYIIFAPHVYQDMTVSFVRITLLGIAEVAIGLICACLPTFNILFTRYQAKHACEAGDPHCPQHTTSLKTHVRTRGGSLTKAHALANPDAGSGIEGRMATSLTLTSDRAVEGWGKARNYSRRTNRYAEVDSERGVERGIGRAVERADGDVGRGRQGNGGSEISRQAEGWPLSNSGIARPTKAVCHQDLGGARLRERFDVG
ncbi:hypothetical protein JHW43_002526 [Diplocarpon mali]|nr:hypothetical protein JHW43_002526 [Diplocarpon mali]